MKKILSAILCFLMLFSLCACSLSPKTPVDNLSALEKDLYDALLIVSDSFFNPSEMRILDVGDSDKIVIQEDEDSPYVSGYHTVTVRIQGENKSGGVSNDYYRLYLNTFGGKDLATAVAARDFDKSDYWKENWDTCKADEYPRSGFETFEAYRQHTISYALKTDFYHTKEALDKAAEEDAKRSWDSSSADEYPRTSYSSYESYLSFYYRYYAGDRYVIADYDKETLPERDSWFGKFEPVSTSILFSEDTTYDIAKINRALKYYWDKKLGNID